MSDASPRTSEQVLAEASADFVRRAAGPWTSEDQRRLEQRLLDDETYASAYGRLIDSLDAMERAATSPALMKFREEAIGRARRRSPSFWRFGSWSRPQLMAAAAALVMIGLLSILIPQWLARPPEAVVFETGIGEQRTIELQDRSRVSLDAATKLSVQMSADARLIRLIQGQAQFAVAKDSQRPFKVAAGAHEVVALGTVFTLEYLDGGLNVAMIEGKVAVAPTNAGPAAAPINVVQGQGLHVDAEGRTRYAAAREVANASAWRDGKVIFDSETLAQAVRRMNRYSRLQLRVEDAQLANLRISGVFDIGDSLEFASAVKLYLPVAVDSSDPLVIHIRPTPRID